MDKKTASKKMLNFHKTISGAMAELNKIINSEVGKMNKDGNKIRYEIFINPDNHLDYFELSIKEQMTYEEEVIYIVEPDWRYTTGVEMDFNEDGSLIIYDVEEYRKMIRKEEVLRLEKEIKRIKEKIEGLTE